MRFMPEPPLFLNHDNSSPGFQIIQSTNLAFRSIHDEYHILVSTHFVKKQCDRKIEYWLTCVTRTSWFLYLQSFHIVHIRLFPPENPKQRSVHPKRGSCFLFYTVLEPNRVFV